MILRHHKPAPPLADFIQTIWHCECYQMPHLMERILPSGDMSIIVNLREGGFRVHDETFPGAILSGTHADYFTIDTAQQAYTLGIHFKPGGSFPFLKMPAGELEGRHVALSELWGAHANDLREKLLAATSVEQRFHIVDQTLLAMMSRMEPPRDLHPAVGFALREIGKTNRIEELASRIGLSSKRFTDVFRNEVGLTPKLFFRIRRFQSALRLLSEGKRVEWADFALASGYYDQSHFIRDFQAFSGINPSAYVPRPAEYTNHMPLPD